MEKKELIKEIGIAGIFLMLGVAYMATIQLNDLDISLGMTIGIGILMIPIILVSYAVIKYFTGAKVSDLAEALKTISNLKELFDKLLDMIGDSSGNGTE